MQLLDMRTVLAGYVISNLICLIFMVVLWRQARRWFQGTGFWLARFALHWVGVMLVALRGWVPDFLSIVVGTAMVIAGTLLLYIGLQHFVGKPGSQIHNFILLWGFFLGYSYFTIIVPSLGARSFFFSAGMFIFCAQSAWLTLRQVDRELAPLTREVGITMLFFCVDAVLLFWSDVAFPVKDDLMLANSGIVLTILITQMLSLVLSFNLFSMVNHRLVGNLSDDITRRTQTEETLRQSEEKFYKAFQSSPDAIIISHLDDGQIVDVNDGFVRALGIPRQEALASSTVDLMIWKNLPDRDQLMVSLRQEQRVQDREFDFRSPAGQIFHGLYSGEIISLNGKMCILSTVRDITEKKQAEKLIQLRLDLWEYASFHGLEEVMQKALDEIGDLTNSPIGFYHLVEEDQNTLTLKAWSTRTRAEFCTAAGEGSHYPIDEAGVWVDCVYQRKPVIHNDYASLPHRKGLPAGHAQVVRELVVPTMRNNQVVAILGMGNKATEYTERDVALISDIADVTWTIIEHKNAVDQIHLLNTRLEHMAMSDALTGLNNRRAFFKLGEAEMKRVRRYQADLSLIMWDIDNFKQVNDTYGHEYGDFILQSVANTLRTAVREVDIPARLGGDEFVVLLPNTTAVDAIQLGERIRLAIEQSVYVNVASGDQHSLCVTVSVGVATYRANLLNLGDVLRLADQALYQAKHLGRNRVVYLGET